MPPSFFGRYKYLILVVAVVLLIVFTAAWWYLRPTQPPQGSADTSNAAPLPDIPAPAGWQAMRQGPDRIIFTRQGKDFAHNGRIDVEAFKIGGTLEETLAQEDVNYPFDSYASTGVGPLSWAQINGNLVLVSVGKEDISTSLEYTLFHQGTMYMFSLLLYQFIDPQAKKVIVQNPEDIPVIQKMVDDFAVTL